MRTMVIFFALAFLFVSGCAVVDYGKQNQATSRLVTAQITARFAESSSEPAARARAVRSVVNTIRNHVRDSTDASITDIERIARSEIDWASMSVADRQLLEFAFLKARQSLDDLVGGGVLDAEARVTISTFFDWIDRAAMRVEMRND